MKKYSLESDGDKWVVFDVKKNYKIDLGERLLEFGVKTIQFLGTLPHKSEYEVFRYQL